jgi:hypothetical protein
MIKNITTIRFSVNGKDHVYHCELDATTAECKEALFQMQKVIGLIEDNAKAVTVEEEKPQSDNTEVNKA